jgi:hypothetical protein
MQKKKGKHYRIETETSASQTHNIVPSIFALSIVVIQYCSIHTKVKI